MRGYCNRCGACCSIRRNGKEYRCEHLIVLTAIGRENGSLCAVHDARYEAMPIRVVAEDGSSFPEFCIPDYPGEDDFLPPTCTYIQERTVGPAPGAVLEEHAPRK